MKNGSRPLLGLILLTYIGLGILYAVFTPLWQVPDEPAHYNYIRALTEGGALPVMEQGDYDQDYIWRLVEAGFPPGVPIEPITYEDHQPPLYYLLATIVYLPFGGAVLPLRLFSVALGAAVLAIAYGLIRDLFPTRPSLALVAAAFIAFLPQHVAMMAGVENDGLAEVLVGAVLWMAVRYVSGEAGGRQYLIGLGSTLGLAVLTKTTAYVALPVTLVAIGLRARREKESLRWALAQAGWVFLAAALLAGPWLIRNVTVYGWTDPLGLVRHNGVVEGQPRTGEWLAAYGWPGLLGRFLRTTFQSFWGQFGWMTVPFHPPIYAALALFSALLVVGLLGWLLDRRRPRLASRQVDGLLLLGASAGFTLLEYLGYNLTFVQHQGRYLFPALTPLALGAALGLEWLLSPRAAGWTGVGLAGTGGLLVLWGLVRAGLSTIPVGAAFGLAALFGLTSWLPRWRRGLAAALVAGLVVLDVYALFGAVVPMLSR